MSIENTFRLSISENWRSKDQGRYFTKYGQKCSYGSKPILMNQVETLVNKEDMLETALSISENVIIKDQSHHIAKYGQNLLFGSHD